MSGRSHNTRIISKVLQSVSIGQTESSVSSCFRFLRTHSHSICKFRLGLPGKKSAKLFNRLIKEKIIFPELKTVSLNAQEIYDLYKWSQPLDTSHNIFPAIEYTTIGLGLRTWACKIEAFHNTTNGTSPYDPPSHSRGKCNRNHKRWWIPKR